MQVSNQHFHILLLLLFGEVQQTCPNGLPYILCHSLVSKYVVNIFYYKSPYIHKCVNKILIPCQQVLILIILTYSEKKANHEYNKFKERTKNNLSPVEIHFLENFEREQKRLTGENGDKA